MYKKTFTPFFMSLLFFVSVSGAQPIETVGPDEADYTPPAWAVPIIGLIEIQPDGVESALAAAYEELTTGTLLLPSDPSKTFPTSEAAIEDTAQSVLEVLGMFRAIRKPLSDDGVTAYMIQASALLDHVGDRYEELKAPLINYVIEKAQMRCSKAAERYYYMATLDVVYSDEPTSVSVTTLP